jgi:hypothetical protein
MSKSIWISLAAGILYVVSWPAAAIGQKLDVKIIQRQTSETGYTYQVAGHANSTSNGSANCNATAYGDSATANCSSTGSTQTTVTAPMVYSYSVTGATFSLQLPDGRIAVVNCVAKFAEHFAGAAGNHRSCRIPIIDDVNVEFKGKSAKIFWPVSLDGKKLESETYTILAVLPK